MKTRVFWFRAIAIAFAVQPHTAYYTFYVMLYQKIVSILSIMDLLRRYPGILSAVAAIGGLARNS